MKNELSLQNIVSQHDTFDLKLMLHLERTFDDDFFIERHIEPWDNIALSNKKKVKVRKLKSKLDSYLDKNIIEILIKLIRINVS